MVKLCFRGLKMKQFDNPNQKKMYEFLREYIKHHSYSPKLSELVDALNMSMKTVRIQRDKLQELGLIHVVAGSQRGIRLLK
jgi:SOS-response transcriptional repressor LexA